MTSFSTISDRLDELAIEVPSWAYGNSGTRFRVFGTPGTPRTVEEKIADAATVHRFTGLAPTVALHIPWDEVDDYGALAAALGAGPEGAREVGRAMARNPAPLIVPCHRVLAANGKPGGFSAAGGVAAKLRMLALEGITLEREAAQASFGF